MNHPPDSIGLWSPQNPPNAELLHGDLTEKILATAFEVSRELGHGFLESVYENAFALALTQIGLRVERQCAFKVLFRGEEVGTFFADMLVDRKVLVELKAVKCLLPEHQAQGINYLKATGIEVGLLINFGTPKIEFKRLRKPQ